MWFLLGIVIGSVVTAFWLTRKSDERVAEAEVEFAKRLNHAQDDALQADSAHQETKTRLIELQLEYKKLEDRLAMLEQDLAKTEERAASAAQVRDQSALMDGATAHPGTPAADKKQAPREQRLKAINAKLAQLPAGSSARAKLLEERELLLREAAPPDASPIASVAGPDLPSRQETDLKRIKGIGAVLERRLKELGVHDLRQMAELSPADIERIDAALDFRGRIEREKWVEQARHLLAAQR